MRSLNDYSLVFPDLVDTADAGVTSRIPVPDGGILTTVHVTISTAITVDEDLTFSILAADGTAVAITGGVVTIAAAGGGAGVTREFNLSKQSDGTDQVPPGGSLQMANDSVGVSGAFRVAVSLRR